MTFRLDVDIRMEDEQESRSGRYGKEFLLVDKIECAGRWLEPGLQGNAGVT